uniref:Magnesium transporter MgtE intracellular domain-containing protein n=1 Tax=Nitratidesulfovibrio vulgaris (strain DSM 19637 / Miyazaki F) TaxID=883 RepID=B8DRQ5_NITV9
MTKPQRFASSLRLSRLCRWLLTAVTIKVALLVAFALEQPWPFVTDAAPTSVSGVAGVSGVSGVAAVSGAPASTQTDATARTVHALQAGQAVQSAQYGQDAESQPLAADIARAVGLTATAPASATGVNDARGRLNREGTAWAAEAQPAPGSAQSPAAPAAPAAPSSALPAAAGLPGSSTMGSGSAAPAAAQPGAQATQSTQAAPNAMDALNRKQDDLSRREQELKSLEQQVDAKLAQMQDLEARIKTMLKDAQGMKDEKLRHLVDVYTNMKAKQAAAVLETLDEKIAVRILAGMRGRQAGEILTFVQAEKAAKLSEALTRMQLPLE